MCVCNEGFKGRDGTNCIKIEDTCKYGSCNSADASFPVRIGESCGKKELNVVCGNDNCCGCVEGASDANNNWRDGCEARPR